MNNFESRYIALKANVIIDYFLMALSFVAFLVIMPLNSQFHLFSESNTLINFAAFFLIVLFYLKSLFDKRKLFRFQEPFFLQVNRIKRGMTYDQVKSIMGEYPPESDNRNTIIYKLVGTEDFGLNSIISTSKTAVIVFDNGLVDDISIDGTRTTRVRHYR